MDVNSKLPGLRRHVMQSGNSLPVKLLFSVHLSCSLNHLLSECRRRTNALMRSIKQMISFEKDECSVAAAQLVNQYITNLNQPLEF